MADRQDGAAMDLMAMVEGFVNRWAPDPKRNEFIDQLRELLEAYGVAALMHESLPDTEHEHGDPV
jgi:hypothetical protein